MLNKKGTGVFFNRLNKKNTDLTEKKAQLEASLAQLTHPLFPDGILTVAEQFSVDIKKQQLVINLTMPFACSQILTELFTELSQQLTVELELNLALAIKPVRQHQINGVKNIIAIASGKGGVGKSTTTVNLAYALQQQGANVAILDADIYGPSIPTMLGLAGQKPVSADGKTMMPLDTNGMQAMSIGFLVNEDDATVWRGPMASTAFSQLLNETQWQNVDYLLIDMPPGTGDIQLTLAQKVPVAGAVIITTPQNVALKDAQKGISMFDKVKVPVLGVVENMSYFECPNCHQTSHIFGCEGGKTLTQNNQTRLLGQLPLEQTIQQAMDTGNIDKITALDDIQANYATIAQNLAAELYYQLDARSPKLATIVHA